MDRSLRGLLKSVSRSMYLSLAVLPAEVREAMGLGYLLCRLADTIADSPAAPTLDRLKGLESYREAFSSPAEPKLALPASVLRAPSRPAERKLLVRAEDALALWRAYPTRERDLVKEVVFGVMEGMRMDLLHFQGRDGDAVSSLDFPVQLERYCAHIGGAPGLFWTRLCQLRLKGLADILPERLEDWGFRLGRGLQMTNILRDVAQDLRAGRCYFPEEDLRKAGLKAKDLLDPSSITRFRPVLLKWTRWAARELEPGEEYVCSMPGLRLRAAVAWPLLLSLKTLTLVVRSPDLLRESGRVKVPRGQVYSLMMGSPWVLASDRRFRQKCAELRGELAEALEPL